MAVSMLAVVVLLLWWHSLLIRHLDVQYGFFRTELKPGEVTSEPLRRYIWTQDEKLARELFTNEKNAEVHADAERLIEERLQNRRKMVRYEQVFFILLLLSGHAFFLYIHYREHKRRQLTEETILLATHELRQPLQSLSLALETVAPKATGRSKRAIEIGIHEISRLGEQIRWLAATFKPGKFEKENIRITDLKQYVENLAGEDFTAEERSRLELNLPAGLGVNLHISASMLHFVLRNLLENALKYAQGQIRFSIAISRTRAELQVAGTGSPMSRQEFSRIGRIFFRSNRADVQNKTGFGLGLYLTSRVVHRSGGKLVIEHDDRGTTTAKLTLRNE